MRVLEQAIRENNLNQVRLLLDLGHDINMTDEDGNTPLNNAVLDEAKPEVILFLLEQGAKPDKKDDYGEAPIHRAIQNHSLEVTKLLLSFGADIEIKDQDGRTPLMHAVYQNQTDILSLLVQEGANLNVMDDEGNTPIHDAAYSNSIDTLKILLESGFSVSEKSASGKLPLHDAAFNNSYEVSELLIQLGADVNAQDANGNTPLHHAIEKNAVDVANLLVQNGASAAIKNNRGESALINVSGKMYGHTLLQQFLQQPLNLDDKDEKGTTALHAAVYGLAVENVAILLDAGASIESEDSQGRTALFECVNVSPSDLDFSRKNEILKILLNHGIHVNNRDNKNFTPLSVAIRMKNIEMIKILLLHGANPEFVTELEYENMQELLKVSTSNKDEN